MDPSNVQRNAHSPLGQAIHAQERLTPGGVAGLIAQMQGAVPGASARDSSSRRGRAQQEIAETKPSFLKDLEYHLRCLGGDLDSCCRIFLSPVGAANFGRASQITTGLGNQFSIDTTAVV